MIGQLLRRFRSSEAERSQVVADSKAEHPYGAAESEPFAIRRLNVAFNDRLTQDEWAYAHGQSLNHDLDVDLATAQAACQNEFTNSTFFRGVCKTYARHVVGRSGPSLQIISDNKAFNKAVEDAWKVVFRNPDPRGRPTGTASLRCDVFHILNGGSSLCVLKPSQRDHPVKVGWQTIHPRRLQTPSRLASADNVAFGVEVDRDGRPVRYYLDRQNGVSELNSRLSDDERYRPVNAEFVRHLFFDEEGEQLTGLPLMHSAVRVSRQVREYDDDVMESAQTQAKVTGVVEASNPEAIIDPDPAPVNGMSITRGQYNYVPVGFRSREVTATQPMAEYRPFRHERLSELGRAIDMPLIFVLLSSTEGNFSQAQFDGGLYAESVEEMQWLLFEQKLEWLVEQVIIDLVLQSAVERPDTYEIKFTWPKPPHANIEKFTKALSQMHTDGAISLVEYCAAMGYDWERVQRNRQRVDEMLDGLHLPLASASASVPDLPGGGESEGDADKRDEQSEQGGERVGRLATA